MHMYAHIFILSAVTFQNVENTRKKAVAIRNNHLQAAMSVYLGKFTTTS